MKKTTAMQSKEKMLVDDILQTNSTAISLMNGDNHACQQALTLFNKNLTLYEQMSLDNPYMNIPESILLTRANVGICQRKLGHLKQATKSFRFILQKVTKTDPLRGLANLQLAIISEVSGDFIAGSKLLREVIEDPYAEESIKGDAHHYLAINMTDEQIEGDATIHYLQAMKLQHPEAKFDYTIHLAKKALASKNFSLALSLLKPYLTSTHKIENFFAHYFSAIAYEEKNNTTDDIDNAMANFKKSIDCCWNNSSARACKPFCVTATF